MLPNNYDNGQNEQDPNVKTTFEAPVAQAPSESSLIQHPLNKPTKSKKTLVIIVSIVGFLLLAAGGVGAYLALKDKADDDSNKDNKTLNLASLGDALKSSIDKSENVSLLTTETPYPATINYRVSDKVWVMPKANSTVMTLSSHREKSGENKKDYDALIQKLKNNGFTEAKALSVNSNYKSTETTTNHFSSNEIVCSLRNTHSGSIYSVQVDCVKKSDFAANIEAVTPLSKVFEPKSDVLFSAPTIQDAATKDYKNARSAIFKLNDLSVGSVVSFYQTPDKKWFFFNETTDPDTISCSDYNTDDLKNAFSGFTCLDASTNNSSFVQKSNPTFEVVPGSQG